MYYTDLPPVTLTRWLSSELTEKVTVWPVLVSRPLTVLGVRLNSCRPGSYSSSEDWMSMGLCLSPWLHWDHSGFIRPQKLGPDIPS